MALRRLAQQSSPPILSSVSTGSDFDLSQWLCSDPAARLHLPATLWLFLSRTRGPMRNALCVLSPRFSRRYQALPEE